MKPVLYTLTDAGILVPVEAPTQAEIQHAYELGFACGQLTGARQAYANMARAIEEKAGMFDATDVENARRGMLH